MLKEKTSLFIYLNKRLNHLFPLAEKLQLVCSLVGEKHPESLLQEPGETDDIAELELSLLELDEQTESDGEGVCS